MFREFPTSKNVQVNTFLAHETKWNSDCIKTGHHKSRTLCCRHPVTSCVCVGTVWFHPQSRAKKCLRVEQTTKCLLHCLLIRCALLRPETESAVDPTLKVIAVSRRWVKQKVHKEAKFTQCVNVSSSLKLWSKICERLSTITCLHQQKLTKRVKIAQLHDSSFHVVVNRFIFIYMKYIRILTFQNLYVKLQK